MGAGLIKHLLNGYPAASETWPSYRQAILENLLLITNCALLSRWNYYRIMVPLICRIDRRLMNYKQDLLFLNKGMSFLPRSRHAWRTERVRMLVIYSHAMHLEARNSTSFALRSE